MGLWGSRRALYTWRMVTPICDKCRRRNVVSYQVEPKDAWRTVVLNRWRTICPSCFDAEAERAGVRYQFRGVGAISWSDRPEPARRYARKHR
jgi:hypothetical protein